MIQILWGVFNQPWSTGSLIYEEKWLVSRRYYFELWSLTFILTCSGAGGSPASVTIAICTAEKWTAFVRLTISGWTWRYLCIWQILLRGTRPRLRLQNKLLWRYTLMKSEPPLWLQGWTWSSIAKQQILLLSTGPWEEVWLGNTS